MRAEIRKAAMKAQGMDTGWLCLYLPPVADFLDEFVAELPWHKIWLKHLAQAGAKVLRLVIANYCDRED